MERQNSQQVNRTALSSKLPTGSKWYNKLSYIVDRMKAIAVSYHNQTRWPSGLTRRSIAGNAVSNPADGRDCSSLVFVCCVCSSLWDGLIIRFEGSYWECVCVCARAPNCMWSRDPNKEVAWDRVELLRCWADELLSCCAVAPQKQSYHTEVSLRTKTLSS